MKLVKEYLGKVSITTEGKHDINRAYDRLSLVYIGENDTVRSYISKKSVPKGVSLGNEDYWQPFSVKVNSGGGGGITEESDPYAIKSIDFVFEKNEETDEFELKIVCRKNNDSLLATQPIGGAFVSWLFKTLEGWNIDLNRTSSEITLLVNNAEGSTVFNSEPLLSANDNYAGLLSASDKNKLDHIEDDANFYDLTVGFTDEDTGESNDMIPRTLQMSKGISGKIHSNNILDVQLSLVPDEPSYYDDHADYRINDKLTEEEVFTLQLDYASKFDAGLMPSSDKRALTNWIPEEYVVITANSIDSNYSGEGVKLLCDFSFENYVYVSPATFINYAISSRTFGAVIDLRNIQIVGFDGPLIVRGVFAPYATNNIFVVFTEESIRRGSVVKASVTPTLDGIIILGL